MNLENIAKVPIAPEYPFLQEYVVWKNYSPNWLTLFNLWFKLWAFTNNEQDIEVYDTCTKEPEIRYFIWGINMQITFNPKNIEHNWYLVTTIGEYKNSVSLSIKSLHNLVMLLDILKLRNYER